MLSTREVIRVLRDENPGVAITEDRVRTVLRSGRVSSPLKFAGRLVWTEADVAQLAQALGLAVKL